MWLLRAGELTGLPVQSDIFCCARTSYLVSFAEEPPVEHFDLVANLRKETISNRISEDVQCDSSVALRDRVGVQGTVVGRSVENECRRDKWRDETRRRTRAIEIDQHGGRGPFSQHLPVCTLYSFQMAIQLGFDGPSSPWTWLKLSQAGRGMQQCPTRPLAAD